MIRRTKDLSKELQYYERDKREIQGKAKFKWLEIVMNGGMRRALFTSIGIHLSPHLAGIGVVCGIVYTYIYNKTYQYTCQYMEN